MNSEIVCIVLYYGGELSVSNDFIPTYVGGKNRPVQIPRLINFDELQKRIMRSLKVDPAQFYVNLVGRFPIGTGFIATHINDDEVCEAVVTAACTQPIVIYVEVNEQPCGDREVNSAVECQPGINNTDYIRPSGYAAREPNYFAGTSSAAMSDPEGDDINPPSLEDVGYETMPSGGSSDDEEENDNDPDETDMRGTEPSIRWMRAHRRHQSWDRLHILSHSHPSIHIRTQCGLRCTLGTQQPLRHMDHRHTICHRHSEYTMVIRCLRRGRQMYLLLQI